MPTNARSARADNSMCGERVKIKRGRAPGGLPFNHCVPAGPVRPSCRPGSIICCLFLQQLARCHPPSGSGWHSTISASQATCIMGVAIERTPLACPAEAHSSPGVARMQGAPIGWVADLVDTHAALPPRPTDSGRPKAPQGQQAAAAHLAQLVLAVHSAHGKPAVSLHASADHEAVPRLEDV